MFPYFLLLIVPFFFSLNGNHVIITKKRRIYMDELAISAFFVAFLLVLSLRNQYLGRDLTNYEIIFNNWGSYSLKTVFLDINEFVFHLYYWAFQNYISSDFQLFVSVTAVLTVLPIMYVYSKNKENGYLKAAVFVNMSTFSMMFSGVRQALAISVGVLAYQALVDKKILRYVFWTFLAIFIHHSGFMVFFFLPLYKFRFRRLDLSWIVPTVAIVFIFNGPIFNFLSSFAEQFDDSYGTKSDQTGAILSFVLFALFAIFAYIVQDENQMDKEAYFLRNILIFAVILQVFASVNNLAMRMNYYFIILIPIALSKSISMSKKETTQIAKVGGIVFCVFFTIYFISTVYVGCKTGKGELDIFPYMAFWEG